MLAGKLINQLPFEKGKKTTICYFIYLFILIFLCVHINCMCTYIRGCRSKAASLFPSSEPMSMAVVVGAGSRVSRQKEKQGIIIE